MVIRDGLGEFRLTLAVPASSSVPDAFELDLEASARGFSGRAAAVSFARAEWAAFVTAVAALRPQAARPAKISSADSDHRCRIAAGLAGTAAHPYLQLTLRPPIEVGRVAAGLTQVTVTLEPHADDFARLAAQFADLAAAG